MRIVVLSDIHANLSALNAVIDDFQNKYVYDLIIVLGDIINYGMRPNETLKKIKSLSPHCCLFGNHEKALTSNDLSRFSTERGKQILHFTAKQLTTESMEFINSKMENSGMSIIESDNKKILLVHGTLSDPYWGKMTNEEQGNSRYAAFDIVISGHSHIPDYTVVLFDDQSQIEYRKKHKTIFLNPGSVGQPRNHNPQAQYLYIDTETESFAFNSVKYDIATEQRLFEGKEVDPFYKLRLEKGI